MQFLQDLMPSLRLARWAPTVIRKHLFNEETESIDNLCAMMMQSDGEYSSLLLAERILNAWEKLDDQARADFFDRLYRDYDIDVAALRAAVDDYGRAGDADALLAVTRAADPPRRELLRRVNLASNGTRRLVAMREDLLPLLAARPELKKVDNDFSHLFNAWFNRGFLLLEPLDWTTPAHILEKIIAYEAVHEIASWAELRKRLAPSDRYCYGFFHPSMEDEPLVFVEVALTDSMPRGIEEILDHDDHTQTGNPSCAIFYSISNCHRGLAGVSFGNFLIKQVATSLKLRFPQLKTFATISPVPGLRRWLEKAADDDEAVARLIAAFDVDAGEASRRELERLAVRYLLTARDADDESADPVARFHLRNGAILERVNVLGDPSAKGMRQSFGTMVNYVYDLSRVEENHESYVHDGMVTCGTAVSKLLP